MKNTRLLPLHCTALQALRRPKLTSLVSAIDELRLLISHARCCDVCGSATNLATNKLMTCANLHLCKGGHARHSHCVRVYRDCMAKVRGRATATGLQVSAAILHTQYLSAKADRRSLHPLCIFVLCYG